MYHFRTTITMARKRDALELLAVANDAESDDELDPTVVEDVEVRVSFTPGWYQPATWHSPPEGEDPEITAVVIQTENGEGRDVLDEIYGPVFDELVRKAWNLQQREEDDARYDPDAYDHARDMEMEDYYD